MLSKLLIGHRQTVTNCKEDPDTEIVKSAIDFEDHYDVSVVADDADVALMLLFHWKPLLHETTFTSERWTKSWNTRDAVSMLQDGLQSHIMVLHAFTGCNTTSTVYAKERHHF